MTVQSDPRELIAHSPMSTFQIVAVAVTVGLNSLDGFDVMSIAFAGPGIAAEWGVSLGTLGIVLSVELIGMAIGSILLGSVADKMGRRPTILGCLLLMLIGMLLVPTASGVWTLSLWRVLTGLGIGGMLSTTNAVAAEFSNAKRRYLSISIMAIGYPIGAVIGGSIVSQLLQSYSWHVIFYLGAAYTAIFIPIVYFLLPESVHWLARKQPDGALARINRTLRRMGHAAFDALPDIPAEIRKRSVTDVLSPALIVTTLLLTLAYFFHMTSFYFIIKWVPKIVVDMGFTASVGASALVWANVGGAIGGIVLGLLTLRFNVKTLTLGALLLSALAVILFANTTPDIGRISMYCAFAGFCTNGAIVGLYAIFAHAFPTHARAFGTGIPIGVGRGGSVLGPIAAGYLLGANVALPIVGLIMGLGSVVAAVALFFVKLMPEEGTDEPAGASHENSSRLLPSGG